MRKLYRQLKGKGFEVVAVDMMEDKATVSAFIKSSGYTFPILLDSNGEVGGNGLQEARAIPMNYLVDKRGENRASGIPPVPVGGKTALPLAPSAFTLAGSS